MSETCLLSFCRAAGTVREDAQPDTNPCRRKKGFCAVVTNPKPSPKPQNLKVLKPRTFKFKSLNLYSEA